MNMSILMSTFMTTSIPTATWCTAIRTLTRTSIRTNTSISMTARTEQSMRRTPTIRRRLRMTTPTTTWTATLTKKRHTITSIPNRKLGHGSLSVWNGEQAPEIPCSGRVRG